MWIFVVCFGFIDSVLMICCFACCLGFVNGLPLGEICLDVDLVLVPFWFKVCMLFGCLGFVVYLSLFVSCCFVLQDTVSVYCLSWLIRFNDVCFVFGCLQLRIVLFDCWFCLFVWLCFVSSIDLCLLFYLCWVWVRCFDWMFVLLFVMVRGFVVCG